MLTYREAMARAARLYLESVLDECDGDVQRAAEMAGRSRGHLYRLIAKFAPELIPRSAKNRGASNG
jgi:DNA-binding NtrC family response regulator